MFTVRLVFGLALLGLLGGATGADAVPSFTRQTGLTCNQCHVSYGGPVPNFTLTGKLFRINGYRLPYIAEKIEAGRPGEVSGRRLNMPTIPYLSLRYQSLFASQSRRPGTTEAGPITSNPTSRLSIFPAGALGDNIGLWVELYLTPDGSPDGEWSLGLFSFDEFDLRFVKLMDNATLGVGFNNQGITEIGGFGPWPVGITNNMTRGGFRGWSHPNRGNLFAYGWFNDRLLGVVLASPGEDNLSWDGRYYGGQIAYALSNTAEREIWLTVYNQFGDDGIPILTSTAPTPERTWAYRDAVSGISEARAAANGGETEAYVSADMGDYMRTQAEMRYGFIDLGEHSLETALRYIRAREEYADRSRAEQDALGGAVRYVFGRTWGLDVVTQRNLNYKYIDSQGTDHDISSTMSYRTYLTYRPAMNFMFVLNAGNSQSMGLNQAGVPTGWSWSLSADFLF